MSKITFKETADQIASGQIKTNLSPLLMKLWIRFAYHFTDLENLLSILEQGVLKSRIDVMENTLMRNDNSSLEVIQNTESWKKQYVRLYHRPKTPTQYHNEGLRSSSTLSNLKAHCPFPVFLLFDSSGILCKDDVVFTSKSLALHSDIEYYSTPEEYAKLPFDKIFHDGGFSPDEKEDIIQHRQAEILIPNELTIDGYLKFILVRSINEKKTLLNQLTAETREKYKMLIRIDKQANIFFRYWTFIDEIVLKSESMTLMVNVGLGQPKFNLRVEVTNLLTNSVSVKTMENWQCEPKLKLTFRNTLVSYSVKVFLDDKLLGHDYFLESDYMELPF